jgi:hypothetical protein
MAMGQLLGMVEQSQEYQLEMPLMRDAALLFRRQLSAGKRARRDSCALSSLREFAAPSIVASVCVYFAGRGDSYRRWRVEFLNDALVIG